MQTQVISMAGGYTSNSDPNPFSAFNSLGGQNLQLSIFSLFKCILGLRFLPLKYLRQRYTDGHRLRNGTSRRRSGLRRIICDGSECLWIRNGVLIGLIRREIEFTVITCIGNNPPNLSASIKDADYEIFESDSLCFTISATDPDGDSIYVSFWRSISAITGGELNAPYALVMTRQEPPTLQQISAGTPFADKHGIPFIICNMKSPTTDVRCRY